MTDAVERYPHVFRPLVVGRTALRNRIFVPAHTTNYGADNLPTDRHLAYHRARARGGAALIIFEGIRVHPSSLGRNQGVNGYDRAAIPRFARIAEAVRAEGGRLFGQILHLGRHIDGNYTRTAAWSASPIPWTATAPAPHPMTTAEIEEVVEAHADVARNLVEAGLDGIELQLAHGHLLQQFLSPLSNQRDDAWGGSLENRLRFAADTLARVRAAVGPDVTLGIRVSGDEYAPGGLTIADMELVTRALCDRTAVDFVNVSHSAYMGADTISTQMADMAFDPAPFRELPRRLAAALDGVAQRPAVFGVCRYRTIAEAEAELARGTIDMVGMARAHIADPAIVAKAAGGAEATTRPCIGCNQGCAGFLALNLAITCLTNPAAGREETWQEPTPLAAARRRRVLVVGGGPAGAEAAAVAAGFGHRVTLVERASTLGGTLAWSRQMPLRREIDRLLAYQAGALERLQVEVLCDTEATVELVQGLDPDVVILATGAEPRPVAVEGSGRVWTLEAALAAGEALGTRVALEDRLGTWSVVSVAEHLARAGADVDLLAPTGMPGWTINIYSSFALRRRLADLGVRIRPLWRTVGWDDGTLRALDGGTGEEVALDGLDALIAPDHALPRQALLVALREAGFTGACHDIGDARSARTALEAVFEGQEIARRLSSPAPRRVEGAQLAK